jgi:hypothetical protein
MMTSPSHRPRIIATIILVFAAVLTLAGGSASAAPQVITMTPTSLDRIMQPGSTYTGSFQILNQGKSDYTFRVYAAPYSVKGEDYTPDFTPLPNAPDVVSWIKFSANTVHMNPGQTSTINYTVAMPQGTPPGGYYAAAFAETRLAPKANSVVLNERVGEIFYLQAAGPITRAGKVLTWQSSLLQKPPLTSALRLENTGGAHYPATIKVKVQDIFGHDKYTLKTVKEVLPHTIRRVTVPWQKTPSIGIFKVNGTVSFLGQNQTLPTRWVLVISQTIRLYLVIALAAIVLLVVGRRIVYRRRPTKKPRR